MSNNNLEYIYSNNENDENNEQREEREKQVQIKKDEQFQEYEKRRKEEENTFFFELTNQFAEFANSIEQAFQNPDFREEKQDLLSISKTSRIDPMEKKEHFFQVLIRIHSVISTPNLQIIDNLLQKKEIFAVQKLLSYKSYQTTFPILFAVHTKHVSKIDSFLENSATNVSELRLALIYSAFLNDAVLVERFLLDSRVFQLEDIFQLAREDTFPVTINPLIRMMEPSKTYNPLKKWSGMSTDDVKTLTARFWTDKDNRSFCPICCIMIERNLGCMYVHHDCKRVSSSFSKRLYLQYNKVGQIYFCMRCSRICNNHKHYQEGSIYEPLLVTRVEIGTDPFGYRNEELSCRNNGGGGEREKIQRIQAYIQTIVDLQSKIGIISVEQAHLAIVEAMWNVRESDDPSINTILQNKQFSIPELLVQHNLPNVNILANTTQNARNARNLDLLPTIDTEGFNAINLAMGFKEKEAVIQFHHRMKNGEINHHETTKISQINLEGEIRRRIEEGQKEEELAQCWYNPPTIEHGNCSANMHPDEIQHLVTLGHFDPTLATKYKEKFQQYYTQRKGGARKSKRKTTYRKNRRSKSNTKKA